MMGTANSMVSAPEATNPTTIVVVVEEHRTERSGHNGGVGVLIVESGRGEHFGGRCPLSKSATHSAGVGLFESGVEKQHVGKVLEDSRYSLVAGGDVVDDVHAGELWGSQGIPETGVASDHHGHVLSCHGFHACRRNHPSVVLSAENVCA